MPDGEAGPSRGVTAPRRYTGQRAVHIAVRTAHIGAAGVVLGGVTLGADVGVWPRLALLTGLALVADDVYRYGEDWLRYAQAWAILGKLVLLGIGVLHPALLAPAVWSAVVIGGVIAHAPGAVRQAALWGEAGPCASKGTRPVRACRVG